MGKPTISMAIFNRYVVNYQKVYIDANQKKTPDLFPQLPSGKLT